MRARWPGPRSALHDTPAAVCAVRFAIDLALDGHVMESPDGSGYSPEPTKAQSMDAKRKDLTRRNFPTAQEEAQIVTPAARYDGPESAYRLAFTDTEFLLREELRPVRMQLELLKPELVQQQQGIESTIVIFGSARIVPSDVAARLVADARSAGNDTALRMALTHQQ